MKKAVLLAPLFAALLFTIPESWQLMNREESRYIPVIFEVLLFVSGYLAAFALNVLAVLPLCWLAQRFGARLPLGLGLALLIALIVTTVAYAYEIFGYRASILEPEYFYPLFIPLFVMSLASFYFLRAGRVPAPEPRPEQEGEEPAGAIPERE